MALGVKDGESHEEDGNKVEDGEEEEEGGGQETKKQLDKEEEDDEGRSSQHQCGKEWGAEAQVETQANTEKQQQQQQHQQRGGLDRERGRTSISEEGESFHSAFSHSGGSGGFGGGSIECSIIDAGSELDPCCVFSGVVSGRGGTTAVSECDASEVGVTGVEGLTTGPTTGLRSGYRPRGACFGEKPWRAQEEDEAAAAAGLDREAVSSISATAAVAAAAAGVAVATQQQQGRAETFQPGSGYRPGNGQGLVVSLTHSFVIVKLLKKCQL